MLIPIFPLPPHVNISISHTYHLESLQPVHLSPHPVSGAPRQSSLAPPRLSSIPPTHLSLSAVDDFDSVPISGALPPPNSDVGNICSSGGSSSSHAHVASSSFLLPELAAPSPSSAMPPLTQWSPSTQAQLGLARLVHGVAAWRQA